MTMVQASRTPMAVRVFWNAFFLVYLAITQGRAGSAQQFSTHRLMVASSWTIENQPTEEYPVVPTAPPPVAPSGRFLLSSAHVPSYPAVYVASTPLAPPPSPPPPRPAEPPFPPSNPCVDCQLCLDKLQDVARLALANVRPSNNSDVTARFFKDVCDRLPAAYTTGCTRVASDIAQAVGNFLAARPAAMCSQLGACKTSLSCPNLHATLPSGAVLNSTLDRCTLQGVANGTIVTLPSVNRTSNACRYQADCTTAGDVCFMGESGRPPQECFCADGRDTCYNLGTCTPFCSLPSTTRQLGRLNAGAQPCTPSSDTCGDGKRCVSLQGCKMWNCSVNALVSSTCEGRCMPLELKVIKAQLVNSGAGVDLTLNAYATKLINTPCENIFDDATVRLLGGAQCTTTNDNLYVRLPATATIKPGDLMVLRSSGSSLTAQVDSSVTFSGNATLQVCSSCALPNPVIVGPSAIEPPCGGDDLVNAAGAVPPSFDASLSSHPSGRTAWTNVVWSLSETGGVAAGRDILRAVVNRTNSITNPNDRLKLKLTLNESTNLPQGQGYTISVTLTSWLNTTRSVSWSFNKGGDSSPPSVKVVGPAVQQFLLSSGLRVGAEAGQVCGGKAVNWLWNSTWVGWSGGGVVLQQLFLSPPLMAKHGTEIKLRIYASFDGSSTSSYDEVTMIGLGSKPIARIRGRAGKVSKTGTLVFNATSSRDPDTTPEMQQLEFSWDCRREDYPNPCFTGTEQGDWDTTPGVWQIPASLLTAGIRHTITVTVNKVVPIGTSALTSSTSMQFEVAEAGSFPTGTLSRMCSPDQCAKPHNTADDLAIMLAMDAGFSTGITVIWASEDVPSIATLKAVQKANGAFFLTVPSAILPTNLDEISISAKMTSKDGATGLAFLKVSLDAPPFCTLNAANPSKCLEVVLANKQYPQAVATISAIEWSDYVDGTELTYEFGTVNGSKVNLQQLGSTTTATLLGLFYGNVTLYGCAVDSSGGRTCASVTVQIDAPPKDFDAGQALSKVNLTDVAKSNSKAKLFGAANLCGGLFRWFSRIFLFGHHRRLGRMLQATDNTAIVSSQTIELINGIMAATNLKDLDQVKLAFSSVANTANNAANLLTAEAAEIVIAALEKLITSLSSSSDAGAVSTTTATQTCSILASAMPSTLNQSSAIQWLGGVINRTANAAVGLGKQATPGSFLSAGTDGVYLSAGALALTGDSFASATVRSGPSAGATVGVRRRSTQELVLSQIESQAYPQFQQGSSARRLQQAGSSSSKPMLVDAGADDVLDSNSGEGLSEDALPYSRRSLAGTSADAEAALTFSGSGAVDASTCSLGLMHVTQVKGSTAAADVLKLALGSQLPSSIVLASGMVDVTWKYMSSGLPGPTLDGTNSYITLKIPVTANYDDAKVKACLQYDTSTNTIKGSLPSLTASAAPALFVGYDGTTGLITCNITAPGTYIVGLGNPPAAKEEKTTLPPEEEKSSNKRAIIGGVVGGVGGAIVIAIVVALIIIHRRKKQSVVASSSTAAAVGGASASSPGASNSGGYPVKPSAASGPSAVAPIAADGQPQGNGLNRGAGDFELPNTPGNKSGSTTAQIPVPSQ
ncbi:hypothetical protein Vretimale_16895 [Volvox reticuliferus]|uniref:Saposin B-type domain-containing protein n=1 Tax=Volvox reticuliferus TaxID=1737510 RepID=A0A8J4FY22_9CHLO|nr:hypothetical protein Vretifemale_16823 [Volvox reticuliferus]GIM13822.1 hypothetical protein Vretimale_16895 [Volvox reticuliferus]